MQEKPPPIDPDARADGNAAATPVPTILPSVPVSSPPLPTKSP
jgi:hypothetical protein